MSKEKNKLEYKLVDGVVHIVYSSIIPTYIEEIADMYEGKIENRIGINFPIYIAMKYNRKEIDNIIQFKEQNAKYVVVYKKGDKLTKEHEMMHAKYYMDEKYKENVNKIWKNMKESSKKKVIDMLKKMGYPEEENILIDEFQAYYYTEKKNFFGKDLL